MKASTKVGRTKGINHGRDTGRRDLAHLPRFIALFVRGVVDFASLNTHSD